MREIFDIVAGIASFIAVVGTIFAAIYWRDLRKQDLWQKRWDRYQQVFRLIWSFPEDGRNVPSGLQIAAVYSLLEFEDFTYATVCGLEGSLNSDPTNDDARHWKELMTPHLTRAIATLKATDAYKKQSKRYAE